MLKMLNIVKLYYAGMCVQQNADFVLTQVESAFSKSLALIQFGTSNIDPRMLLPFVLGLTVGHLIRFLAKIWYQ